MTKYITASVVSPQPNNTTIWTINDTVSTLTEVIAEDYLLDLQQAGLVFNPQDQFFINYVGGSGNFQPIFVSASDIVLCDFLVGQIKTLDLTVLPGFLASAGKMTLKFGIPNVRFFVRGITVNYGSAGLSGGGGNRLLSLSDGTTVYNGTGITAALLGTPVNTVFGGSGNPVAGSVAQNTPTAQGADIYFQYIGGTTDYTTGSVTVSVNLQRYS